LNYFLTKLGKKIAQDVLKLIQDLPELGEKAQQANGARHGAQGEPATPQESGHETPFAG
jgi:hypothetical protein